MAWIRLSDNYIDHPKFLALNASAFRLWHEGMAYCRKHQTDGLITMGALQGFRYYKPVRAAELATPYEPGAVPLWEPIEGDGFRVHDYLEWNPSKEETSDRRLETKDRMQRLRSSRARGAPLVRANSVQTTRDVLDRIGSDPDQEKKRVENRAARLREELYPAWYAKWRNGARLRLVSNSLEFQDALSLVQTWDDNRLEKLAKIVLTTNDEFIAGTDRGFHIFAIKASWADDRLRQAESGGA